MGKNKTKGEIRSVNLFFFIYLTEALSPHQEYFTILIMHAVSIYQQQTGDKDNHKNVTGKQLFNTTYWNVAYHKQARDMWRERDIRWTRMNQLKFYASVI